MHRLQDPRKDVSRTSQTGGAVAGLVVGLIVSCTKTLVLSPHIDFTELKVNRNIVSFYCNLLCVYWMSREGAMSCGFTVNIQDMNVAPLRGVGSKLHSEPADRPLKHKG